MVKLRNTCRRAALHIAAAEGHLSVVEFLLESGADPKAKDGADFKPWCCVDATRGLVRRTDGATQRLTKQRRAALGIKRDMLESIRVCIARSHHAVLECRKCKLPCGSQG
eukprot:2193421-Amphidinium_carterae.1